MNIFGWNGRNKRQIAGKILKHTYMGASTTNT